MPTSEYVRWSAVAGMLGGLTFAGEASQPGGTLQSLVSLLVRWAPTIPSHTP